MTSLPCPIQATCGGCPAMERPADQVLADKVARVTRGLGRPPDLVVPSPRSLGYRARITLAVHAEGHLGYHRHHSHDFVGVTACAIARPEIDAVLGHLPPLPGLDSVELRSDGTAVVLAARGRGPRAREVLADLDLDGIGLAGVALGGRPLAGRTTLDLRVGGIHHRPGPDSFVQVNLEVNEALVGEVVAASDARHPEAVLDLFAGGGNLGLALAARGVPVTLVESAPSSVRDARDTARRHGLTAEVHCQDAWRWRAGDAVFDLAVLDPPRAGAAGVIEQVLFTRPRAMILVSCNPDSLARELRPAFTAGYALSRLVVLDMFPQTNHTEALCVLDRAGRPG